MESETGDWQWGIVSVKAQDEGTITYLTQDFELPMSPITMMRNALPVEHGGSGVLLERPAYMTSVAYWQHHAMLH